ncbi:MAG: DUF2271 domain-containing protein [Bacteroidales bacterium]|nr:DUF2271 domain-containing protein [Bacteroidales bacterium]
MKKTLLILVVFAFYISASAQSLTFNVTTVTDNGPFSPKHVLAVWIEDNAGNFVKSNKVMAVDRKQYLYTWNTQSGGNSTDATTGETLTAHQAHTITWNCQNLSSEVVPDGDYKIRIEYTDQHAQGPMFSVDFTVSGSTFNVDPADQTYFKDMSLDYMPATTGLESVIGNQALSVYPNPSTGVFYINFASEENGPVNLKVIDISGRVLYEKQVSKSEFTNYPIQLSDLKTGIYILKLSVNNKEIQQKIVIQ